VRCRGRGKNFKRQDCAWARHSAATIFLVRPLQSWNRYWEVWEGEYCYYSILLLIFHWFKIHNDIKCYRYIIVPRGYRKLYKKYRHIRGRWWGWGVMVGRNWFCISRLMTIVALGLRKPYATSEPGAYRVMYIMMFIDLLCGCCFMGVQLLNQNTFS
jgi:hypothetical protein